MKIRYIIELFCLMLVACTPKVLEEKGVVVETTSITVAIVTLGGDTLTFHVADEPNSVNVYELLIGDTATIEFVKEENVLRILKVKTNPFVEESISGIWLKPIDGVKTTEKEGFEIHDDGTVESVNMYTLLYHTWQRMGDTLVFMGESLGNGQSFDFSDTFKIKSLSSTQLVLEKTDYTDIYTKQ